MNKQGVPADASDFKTQSKKTKKEYDGKPVYNNIDCGFSMWFLNARKYSAPIAPEHHKIAAFYHH